MLTTLVGTDVQSDAYTVRQAIAILMLTLRQTCLQTDSVSYRRAPIHPYGYR